MARFDETFKTACANAGVYPSRQQYRKWRHHRGAAYLSANNVTRKDRDTRYKETPILDKEREKRIGIQAN
jgi:hypothetical protein